MAPINEGLQGLVAQQGGAASAGEQVKAILQSRGDLLDTQAFYARGRQFKRQRDAVELMADLGDGKPVVVCQPEARQSGLRTLDE